MKAVILCAGLGTRLRPLTYYISKAMIPVAGKPTLERIIERLKACGFEDYIIALSLFPEQAINYFGDGSRLGVRIAWSVNPEPGGTSGELCAMARHLEKEENFVLHYGDIVSDFDIPAMVEDHLAHNATTTVGLITSYRVSTGVAHLAPDRRITHFEEKPIYPEPSNAAILVLSRRAMDYMRVGEDISTDALPAMLRAGEPVFGFPDEHCYWFDIGQLSALEKANESIAELEARSSGPEMTA